MEILTLVILPAVLAGVAAFVDNALKGEPVLPCLGRGFIAGWVVGVIVYVVFVSFNIKIG
jgi:hypothetical protein